MQDTFTEAERNIFSYPDGMGGEVWSGGRGVWNPDTKTLERPKDADGQEIPESPDELVARLMAEERLYDAVRVAFGLQPFNRQTGGGATEDVCRIALNHYLRFLEKKG